MKVLLTAFGGKLQSDVLDFPENTSPKIEMIMDFDRATWGYEEQTPSPLPIFKKGEFVWDGKTTFVGSQEVRHYKLVDVR